jgi:nitrate reductase NapE component
MKRMILTLALTFLIFSMASAVEVCSEQCACLTIADAVILFNTSSINQHFCNGNETICGYDSVTGQENGTVPMFCFGISTTVNAEKANKSPGSHTWWYDPNSTDIYNEMLLIKLNSSSNEDISLTNITIQANGTGNDSVDITKIEYYIDNDADGVRDANESKIGASQPAFIDDDGTTTTGLTYNLLAGQTRYILVTYVMSSTAPVGKTYSFTVSSIYGVGKTTNKTVSIENLPMDSAVKTIVAPSCRGTLALTLTPNSVNQSKTITAKMNSLIDCNNYSIVVQPNSCASPIPISTCSCTVNGTGCSCNFNSSSNSGNYTFWACIDANKDGDKIDAGENASAILRVSATEPQQHFNQTNQTNEENQQPTKKPLPETKINLTNTTNATQTTGNESKTETKPWITFNDIDVTPFAIIGVAIVLGLGIIFWTIRNMR